MAIDWNVVKALAAAVSALAAVIGVQIAIARRRVRVRVHQASLRGQVGEQFFVDVTNHSRRDVEITHVWFATDPEVHVLQPDRLLPKRLRPDEPWQTWVPVTRLPELVRANPYRLARVKLSTGRVLSSRRNRNVPAAGVVPGGPIQWRPPDRPPDPSTP